MQNVFFTSKTFFKNLILSFLLSFIIIYIVIIIITIIAITIIVIIIIISIIIIIIIIIITIVIIILHLLYLTHETGWKHNKFPWKQSRPKLVGKNYLLVTSILHIRCWLHMYIHIERELFRTQSNIWDGVFLQNESLRAVNYFCK